MLFRLTNRLQVNGFRFLLNRAGHALLRRDTSMHDDPIRLQTSALNIGMSLALVVVVGALALSFISPRGTITPSTKIVRDRDNGGLYVRVGNTLNPVMNLASARLIAGTPANPTQVKGSAIDAVPRGPLVGIPAAPDRLDASTPIESEWTVCDAVTAGSVTTTVIAGPTEKPGNATTMGGRNARLVTDGSKDYLLWNGHRAEIDLSDTATTLPLGITPATPVTRVSDGLFNAFPPAPKIQAPRIADAGSSAPYTAPMNLPVGTTLEVRESAARSVYYVILDKGVQQIPLAVATMIRAASKDSATAPTLISPAALSSAPQTADLDISNLPPEALNFDETAPHPVTCFNWSRQRPDTPAVTAILTGQALPLSLERRAAVVNPALSGSPSIVGAADAIAMPPAAGRLVTVTGINPGSPLTESLYWVSDTGVRYGIPVETATAKPLDSLGVGVPQPAPWAIIRLIPEGPALSATDALQAHTRFGVDAAAQPATTGQN